MQQGQLSSWKAESCKIRKHKVFPKGPKIVGSVPQTKNPNFDSFKYVWIAWRGTVESFGCLCTITPLSEMRKVPVQGFGCSRVGLVIREVDNLSTSLLCVLKTMHNLIVKGFHIRPIKKLGNQLFPFASCRAPSCSFPRQDGNTVFFFSSNPH